jgi:hypothetical protein
MSKRIKIFLVIFSLPFVFMYFVNEILVAPNRTNNYKEDYCTWYCHNVTCLHYKESYKIAPTTFKKSNKQIFDWYVTSLHANKLGLNYRNINLLVFILVYPVLASLLLWNLIRKVK